MTQMQRMDEGCQDVEEESNGPGSLAFRAEHTTAGVMQPGCPWGPGEAARIKGIQEGGHGRSWLTFSWICTGHLALKPAQLVVRAAERDQVLVPEAPAVWDERRQTHKPSSLGSPGQQAPPAPWCVFVKYAADKVNEATDPACINIGWRLSQPLPRLLLAPEKE